MMLPLLLGIVNDQPTYQRVNSAKMVISVLPLSFLPGYDSAGS